jgi:hypothetical protein
MRLLWSFLALTALTATALAQTTLYQTSFENPPFTAGQPAPPNDDWANGSGTGVSHVVTDELANTGSQSLKWDNSGTNNSFYSIRRVLNWQPTDPDKLVVKVRVYITAGTGANRLYGVYLTGSDTGTLGGTILGVTIAGDGKIRVGTTWGATYSSSTWLAQAPAGTYENRWLQVEMTYDRGSEQATIKVSGFADNAEYTANLTQSTPPRNINLGTDYVTTTASNGIGYFDDLSITAEAGTPFDGWDETANGGGDAGDLPETAQSTGSDPITKIRGTIGGANDVDVYAIYISDPDAFSATTIGGTTLDTALWLFDEDGKGVVYNDDNPDATTGTQSRIDNRTNCITQPGRYYLAVSISLRRAAGCGDGLIWATTPARGVRCPDGAESASRVAGWSGSSSSTGRYIIFLTGVSGATAGDPADCPPPDPWDEQFYGGGDAGDLPATAQLVTLPDQTPCQSPVTRIRGDNGASDVDMYVICITDPANFVASTVGTTDWDTQLWLFRCDGTGVVHNDDNPDATTGLQSRIDNRTNCIQQGGIYLLAISRYNRDAVDANGNLLWNNSPFREVRCPDGPGAANPVAGWTGTTSAGGRYVISLQGAYFVSDQGCEGGPGQCEGDANRDGRVDDADLLVVLFQFGEFGFGLQGDVNNDGRVDDADLLIVLFNFGCGS